MSENRWMTAVEAADRILEDGRLVDAGLELVPPAFFVIRLLSDPPPAFLEAYRHRWATRTSSPADAPRTVSEWSRRFYEKGMDEIGNELALRALDRGNAGLALRIWKAVYEHHPDPTLPRDLLAARIIWAAAVGSSPEEIPDLQELEKMVQVGENRLRISEWKNLAIRSRHHAPRADWSLCSSKPVVVGPVTVELVRSADAWGISIHMGDRRADLFTADPFLADFLKIVVWTTGDTLGWASTAGVGGEWDLTEWRPAWWGNSAKRPPPAAIAAEVLGALSAERDECVRRLEVWAGTKRALLRSWHSCDWEQEGADLLATSAGCIWICPCGQVTPMDLRGLRGASLSGIGALKLPDSARRAIERTRDRN